MTRMSRVDKARYREAEQLPPITPQAYGNIGRRLDSTVTWGMCPDCLLHHPRRGSADVHPEWVLDIAGTDCPERLRIEQAHPELVVSNKRCRR